MSPRRLVFFVAVALAIAIVPFVAFGRLVQPTVTTTQYSQRALPVEHVPNSVSDTENKTEDNSGAATQTQSSTHRVLAILLIIFIVGGFFFEMQTPGVGISFVIALIASILFFTLFHIAGLVERLDIIIFAVGFLLILLEIFVVPGFGVVGILGLIGVIVGLALALIDNSRILSLDSLAIHDMLVALALVVIGLTFGIFGSMALSHFLTTSRRTPAMALHKSMHAADGYIGVLQLSPKLVGQKGEAQTVLRPAGKVTIAGTNYDAVALGSLIDKGASVVVIKIENNQLYVQAV